MFWNSWWQVKFCASTTKRSTRSSVGVFLAGSALSGRARPLIWTLRSPKQILMELNRSCSQWPNTVNDLARLLWSSEMDHASKFNFHVAILLIDHYLGLALLYDKHSSFGWRWDWLEMDRLMAVKMSGRARVNIIPSWYLRPYVLLMIASVACRSIIRKWRGRPGTAAASLASFHFYKTKQTQVTPHSIFSTCGDEPNLNSHSESWCLQDLEQKIEEALACPCVDDLRNGPCGKEFVGSFSCYVRNFKAEDKASILCLPCTISDCQISRHLSWGFQVTPCIHAPFHWILACNQCHLLVTSVSWGLHNRKITACQVIALTAAGRLLPQICSDARVHG